MLPALRNFAITFFVSLLIFGALAYVFTRFAMQNLSEGFVEDDVTASVETDEVIDVVKLIDNTVDTSAIQGESFTFMLVGLDYQPSVYTDYAADTADTLTSALQSETAKQTEDEASAETEALPDNAFYRSRSVSADAVLVGRIDKEDKRVMLTALPGNTRVLVDGVYTRLGDILTEKGIDFFREKVAALVGLSVDYYAVADIPSVEAIIDRLGGISFRVPCDMTYEDPTEGEEGLQISIKAGTQWLSGKKAVQVLRYFSYDDADISRMTVLRDMASSMLTAIESYTTPATASELYTTLKNSIVTNLSIADFADHLDLIFKIDAFTFVNYSYPGRVSASADTVWFYPDTAAAIAALSQYK